MGGLSPNSSISTPGCPQVPKHRSLAMNPKLALSLQLWAALLPAVVAQNAITNRMTIAPAGFEFIDTGFENASPLWYEFTHEGVIQVHLIYDHERSSPNRAAGHIHF